MIEPGLLRIFRGYAFVRLGLGVLVFLGQVFAPERFISRSISMDRSVFSFSFVEGDSLIVTLGVILAMLLLLAYLYLGSVQKRMGRFYIPMGIAIAIAGLFLEQYLLTPRTFIWQADSFFFILLILVSWQYNIRAVFVFSAAVALADFALNLFVQPTFFFVSGLAQIDPVPQFGPAIFFGRQAGRILSFLVVGFVITSLVAAQRKQRQELAAANRELAQHAGTLEQLATSRERNRLSRELHDTVAHTLSGLTVQLEALQTAWKRMPAQARGMVDKMLGSTRSGLDETRRTLKNLRAAPLEELGLALAIESLARAAGERGNFKVHIKVTKTDLGLADDAQQVFYRVAQEALENAVRHAKAEHVELSLQKKNGHLELMVHDDGAGFSANRKSKQSRFGLTLMKERAGLIGAEFMVESTRAKGTTVRMVY